jgi:aspartate/methionine/tyrosine aminotransferase
MSSCFYTFSIKQGKIDAMAKKKLPPEIVEWFRREGAKGGKKAAAAMTPRQRSERARKAVAAREAKRSGIKLSPRATAHMTSRGGNF